MNKTANRTLEALVTAAFLVAGAVLLIVILAMYMTPPSQAATSAADGGRTRHHQPIYLCSDSGPLPCVYSEPDMGSPTNYQMTHSYLVRKSGEVIAISHERAHRLFKFGR